MAIESNEHFSQYGGRPAATTAQPRVRRFPARGFEDTRTTIRTTAANGGEPLPERPQGRKRRNKPNGVSFQP